MDLQSVMKCGREIDESHISRDGRGGRGLSRLADSLQKPKDDFIYYVVFPFSLSWIEFVLDSYEV